MKKIVMYLSAFLPMFWIILIKDYANIINLVCNNQLGKSDLFNGWLLGMFVAILIISVLFIILIHGNKKLAKDKVKVLKVENKTVEFYLAYFSLFILALLTFTFTSWIDILVITLILTILGIVYIKNDLFYINPSLYLFRKFIYNVEYKNSRGDLVSKIVIANKKVRKDTTIEIYVSDYEFTFADVEELQNEPNDKKAD